MKPAPGDWVVFDVGGVLVDESRMWRGWAQDLGVPFALLWEALREDIRRGVSHRQTMERLAPGRDIAALRRARLLADAPVEGDLFPDVRPALEALRARGVRIGIAGNQPREAGAALARLGLPAAFIATSGEWGVQKPDPGFFARVAAACAAPPAAITYVGDRVDNDVLPALAAGMRAAFLPRGLWAGVRQAPVPALPDLLTLA